MVARWPLLVVTLRGADEIDAFLLIQCPENDLKLRIGKDPRDGKKARCGSQREFRKAVHRRRSP